MRANGWLEEVAGDDARVHSYRLTEAGRSLLDKSIPAWRRAQRKALRLLGDAGVQALRHFARQHGFGE
jgi:DNA-binding MarR family transcriptional regulator